jgi:hypothetical protein
LPRGFELIGYVEANEVGPLSSSKPGFKSEALKLSLNGR